MVSGGGAADPDFGVEDHAARFVTAGGHAFEQQFGGQRSDLQFWLGDGGQWRCREGGEFDVIEADDGELLRHGDAGFACRGESADRHQDGKGQQRAKEAYQRILLRRQRAPVVTQAQIRAAREEGRS